MNIIIGIVILIVAAAIFVGGILVGRRNADKVNTIVKAGEDLTKTK